MLSHLLEPWQNDLCFGDRSIPDTREVHAPYKALMHVVTTVFIIIDPIDTTHRVPQVGSCGSR